MSCCEQFNNLSLLFGGDFNCDLANKSNYSVAINDFLNLHLLHRSDVAIGFNVNYTFFTDTSRSTTDYSNVILTRLKLNIIVLSMVLWVK